MIQLQKNAPLHSSFKNRVLDIANSFRDNNLDWATFKSQELVRDYGTHFVETKCAGATLEKVYTLIESRGRYPYYMGTSGKCLVHFLVTGQCPVPKLIKHRIGSVI